MSIKDEIRKIPDWAGPVSQKFTPYDRETGEYCEDQQIEVFLDPERLQALADSHDKLIREMTDFLQGEDDSDEPARQVWKAIAEAEKL